MRILKVSAIAGVVFFLNIGTSECVAQNNTVTIVQDARFEQLLAEKRKINSSITVNDRYKVQIFSGENDKARKALSDFRRDFKMLDGTLIFESPNYKVWVGNFKTKIEAEKNLEEIRKKFPYSLLIKPNK